MDKKTPFLQAEVYGNGEGECGRRPLKEMVSDKLSRSTRGETWTECQVLIAEKG